MAFRGHYEKVLGQGVERDSFLLRHYAVCGLFLEWDASPLDRVIAAIRAQEDPQPGDLRKVLRSATSLSVIFSGLALKMDFLEYIARIRSSLHDLGHNSFELNEVRNLQAVMHADAEKLISAGVEHSTGRWPRSTSWIGESSVVSRRPWTSSPSD